MTEVRPIDANALIEDYRICGGCSGFENCSGHITMCDSARVRQAINEAQTIEAESVRHGRWIPCGDDMWLCSNCKENIIFSTHESDRTEKQRYCCRCGARMDGGADNGNC